MRTSVRIDPAVHPQVGDAPHREDANHGPRSIRDAVGHARQSGLSWALIGSTIGTSGEQPASATVKPTRPATECTIRGKSGYGSMGQLWANASARRQMWAAASASAVHRVDA
jgi:hypothetical protein